MSIPICQQIHCPYWSNNHKTSYGCRRYPFAGACHLTRIYPALDGRNEYALYAREPIDLSTIQRENNRWFLEDPLYSQQREFLEDEKDWVTEEIPKEIVQPPTEQTL